MRLFAAIFVASAALCQAAESAAGRWEGSAQIPGEELKLIVELSDEGGKACVRQMAAPAASFYREAPVRAICIKLFESGPLLQRISSCEDETRCISPDRFSLCLTPQSQTYSLL